MKQKSIRNIRREFKDKGIFYTPPAVAERIKSYVDIAPETVYDPACGAGNLLKVFPENVRKYGQELDGEQLALIDLPNFTGHAGDTLTDDKFRGMKFDCIVANPPFSMKWAPDKLAGDIRFRDCPVLPPPSKADWAFMLHILCHLSDNGTAVVLEAPGILFRGHREGRVRRWFIENNYIDRVVNIPGRTFEDTSISTCIIVLKRNRATTDVIFEEEGQAATVSLQAIVENDFNLSVALYLDQREEKEEIDPLALEIEARQSFLNAFESQLKMQKMVCEIEGTSIHPFVNALRRILEEYDTEAVLHTGD